MKQRTSPSRPTNREQSLAFATTEARLTAAAARTAARKLRKTKTKFKIARRAFKQAKKAAKKAAKLAKRAKVLLDCQRLAAQKEKPGRKKRATAIPLSAKAKRQTRPTQPVAVNPAPEPIVVVPPVTPDAATPVPATEPVSH